jgi:hypothetical protein
MSIPYRLIVLPKRPSHPVSSPDRLALAIADTGEAGKSFAPGCCSGSLYNHREVKRPRKLFSYWSAIPGQGEIITAASTCHNDLAVGLNGDRISIVKPAEVGGHSTAAKAGVVGAVRVVAGQEEIRERLAEN